MLTHANSGRRRGRPVASLGWSHVGTGIRAAGGGVWRVGRIESCGISLVGLFSSFVPYFPFVPFSSTRLLIVASIGVDPSLGSLGGSPAPSPLPSPHTFPSRHCHRRIGPYDKGLAAA